MVVARVDNAPRPEIWVGPVGERQRAYFTVVDLYKPDYDALEEAFFHANTEPIFLRKHRMARTPGQSPAGRGG
jgi:hypothetical protein